MYKNNAFLLFPVNNLENNLMYNHPHDLQLSFAPILPDGGRNHYNGVNDRHFLGESGVLVSIAAVGAVISSARC